MIDDELLQELLSKGSSLYHNGDYRGAIGVWREALQVDPGSLRAREGIQMATLLLGDWEPPTVDAAAGPAPDGANKAAGARGAGELKKTLDQGIAEVKGLLEQRKYTEALAGARSLVPINPESEDVQRILDEAQQAFESAPFIEEHISLARELLAQERYPEAEAQCNKVFGIDKDNPEARALLEEIQKRSAAHTADAPVAGQTVRMRVSDIIGAGGLKPPAAGPAPAPESDPTGGPGATRAAAPVPEPQGHQTRPEGQTKETENSQEISWEEFDLEMSNEPVILTPQGQEAGAGVETPGETATASTETAAEPDLDPDAPTAADPGANQTKGAVPGPAPAPEAATAGAGADAAAGTPGEEIEVVEAVTVVPPSVRLVPRSETPTTGAASKAAGEPAPAVAAPVAAPAAPLEMAGGEEAAAWEIELTQLNLREGERNILGPGATSPAPSPKADRPEQPEQSKHLEQAEADLLAMLDDSLEMGAGVESIPLADRIPPPTAERGTEAAPEPQPAPAAAPGKAPSPAAQTPRSRPEQRQEVVLGAGLKRPEVRSSAPMYFALLGLLILGGAAGWWFYFQPRGAGGPGSPGEPVAPPAGSSAPPMAVGQPGPIPTPIGGPARQGGANPDPTPEPPATAGMTVAGEATTTGIPMAAAPATAPDGGRTAPERAPDPEIKDAVGTPAREEAGPDPPPDRSPAVPPRRLAPREIEREVRKRLANGTRLMVAGRWAEVLDEMRGAIAIDPGNMEVRGLADKAQARLDEHNHRVREFEQVRKLFEDREYQNALWKLYRLPLNPMFGDIDLHIRNAWYNWAVIAMRAGDSPGALEKLSEVMAIDPDDAEALKMRAVAERYTSRAKDRQYFAYAASLTLRKMDQN